MENAVSDYKDYLKTLILTNLNNARFTIIRDGHPVQAELIKDILVNDFKVKYEYGSHMGIYTFYITGYLEDPKKNTIVCETDEVEVEDVYEDSK